MGDTVEEDIPLLTVYDWDTVLVFPREEGGERRSGGKYNMDRFARLLLGFRWVILKGGKRELFVDPAAAILRTDRCFLNDQGEPHQELVELSKELAAETIEQKRNELEKKRVEIKKRFLEDEYKAFAMTDEPILSSKFSELVVRAILKRVQDACGLECKMKASVDGDEIICCLRADDGDLVTEADRTNYKIQVNNRPFDADRKDVSQAELQSMYGDGYKAAIALAQRTCDESDAPLTDPGLFKAKEQGEASWHPRLLLKMKKAGHRNEHEVGVVHESLGGATKFGGGVYLAPYYDYKAEPEYQPFYRHHYRVTGLDPRGYCYTVFRPIDRVRLINSLLARHLNMPVLTFSRLVLAQFALHDEHELEKLRSDWVFSVKTTKDKLCLGLNQSQPLLRIRDYFGEKIAVYFAWLEFYTKMLRWPALIGFILFMIQIGTAEVLAPVCSKVGTSVFAMCDGKSLPGREYKIAELGEITALAQCTQAADVDKLWGNCPEKDLDGSLLLLFGGFVSVWATCQTEMWGRRNAFLNLWWGMTDFSQTEGERPAFYGTVRRSPVNDRKEVQHTSTSKLRKKMYISTVAIFWSVVAAMVAVWQCLELKAFLVKERLFWGKGAIVAGVVNGVVIGVGNGLYTKLARSLTDWENHRTNTEYENNLITKTFLFRFFNSYASFFWIAFMKRPFEGQCLCTSWEGNTCLKHMTCIGELQKQLGSIFVSQIIVGNTTELLIPALVQKMKLRAEAKALQKEAGEGSPVVTYEQPELEAKYAQYEEKESFEDYAEMVVQYGFVTLFVVAFPLVPFFALLNNCLELHVDAHKLCFGRQKPSPKGADSIGRWAYFVSVVSKISVVTNTLLVCFTSSFLEGRSTGFKWILFVSVEHAMLLLKVAVEELVPDAEGYVLTLAQRFDFTNSKLFLELNEDNDDDLEEVAEAVDLTIEPNSFQFGRQIQGVSNESAPSTGITKGVKLVV
eukprot:g3260.t1